MHTAVVWVCNNQARDMATPAHMSRYNYGRRTNSVKDRWQSKVREAGYNKTDYNLQKNTI